MHYDDKNLNAPNTTSENNTYNRPITGEEENTLNTLNTLSEKESFKGKQAQTTNPLQTPPRNEKENGSTENDDYTPQKLKLEEEETDPIKVNRPHSWSNHSMQSHSKEKNASKYHSQANRNV